MTTKAQRVGTVTPEKSLSDRANILLGMCLPSGLHVLMALGRIISRVFQIMHNFYDLNLQIHKIERGMKTS